MCGIAGEIRWRGDADVEAVGRVTAALSARGPDADGEWHEGPVALGHRRLRIIDLSDAGAQPMVDDERGLVVAFNGCIYNHRELREELADGYRFRSESDTEVILAAYDRWGEDFVDHLVGMFAIALLDRRRRRLLLIRDRLGIKPLYIAEVDGGIRFASTLPALLAGGGIDTSIDPVGLEYYLSWHSIVPAPHSILNGVRKLPAATVRTIDFDGRTRERVFWHPDYERDPAKADWTADDWRAAIHDRLRTAVERRLVADVPVGVLLSGGVDSSLIVALMAELGVTDIPTFSIGFDAAGGESGDEFEYSRLVAERFATDHHQLHVGAASMPSSIMLAVNAMTEPMTTPDVTAFFLLCQAVSEYVTVVQSGQGADEVFAGYHYHQPAALVHRSEAQRVFTRAFAEYDHEELSLVVTAERRPAGAVAHRLIATDLAEEGAETALDAILRLDTHTLMVDDPVKRLDSMAMAWSLEARVPFLDQDLVQLAAQCPPELKADQDGKGILKDLARELVPPEVVDRPKGYFPVPGVRHLDDSMVALLTAVLTSPEARARGIFQTEHLEGLLADPNGSYGPVGGNTLWQIGLLELWLQLHHIPA